MPNNLGKALRNARRAKALTQEQLAKLSGVTREEISKIENNWYKNPNKLPVLLKCLNVNVKDFLLEVQLETEVVEEDSLAEKIRKARRLKGLTQEQLAILSDMTREQISNIEHGKTKKPTKMTLDNLYRVLGLPNEQVEEIMKDENSFGRKLQKAREFKGLSRAQLARLTGISQAQIVNIETGKSKLIRKNTLKKLGQYIDTDV